MLACFQLKQIRSAIPPTWYKGGTLEQFLKSKAGFCWFSIPELWEFWQPEGLARALSFWEGCYQKHDPLFRDGVWEGFQMWPILQCASHSSGQELSLSSCVSILLCFLQLKLGTCRHLFMQFPWLERLCRISPVITSPCCWGHCGIRYDSIQDALLPCHSAYPTVFCSWCS